MSSPIRVGLVGLGKHTNHLEPGAWASIAHLPYLRHSSKYTVVAVLTSSVASAQASIDFHKLGSDVKAYGNPEDLAKDANVDLVVISVNVGKHYALAAPALKAGKDVFVEWPLGATTAEAEELEGLAQANGVKTIVGVQAWANPITLKVKELIDSGRIGRVMSSTAVGSFSGLPHDVWMEGAEYYLDKDSGGNALTIHFAHFLDTFLHILGDLQDVQAVLKTQYPTLSLVNSKGEVARSNYQKTAPDTVFVQGTLSSGAVVSINYRTVVGKTIDEIGVRWLITGTEGEIEITTAETWWQMGMPGSQVRMRAGKDAAVEVVDCAPTDGEEVARTPLPGTNTARIYEAFANGETEKYATFSDALKTHRVIDRIRKNVI